MKKNEENLKNKYSISEKENKMQGELPLIELLIKSNKKMTQKIENYNYSNKILPKRNYISSLIYNFLLIILIDYILADSLIENKRNLNALNSIYLNITGSKYTKVLGIIPELPDLVYLNDILTLIDSSGNIFIEKNDKDISYNLTLVWYNPIENCEKLFQSVDSANEIDLSNFDTSKVTTMRSMFVGCKNVKYINFSNVTTSLVTDMTNMFSECNSLTSVDLSNFDTSKVTLMENMFLGCSSLTFLNLSNFDTSKLTKMKSMFWRCEKMESIDLTNFDTSKITNMENLFSECNSLTTLNLSSFNTKKVRNTQSMFKECFLLKSLDLSKMDTSLLTNMKEMFYECQSLTSLNISNFNTSSVEDMEKAFYGCSSLKSLNLSSFNTTAVLNMEYMFFGCKSLISLDLSSFAFNQVKMKLCFSKCYSLKSIEFPKEQYIASDIYSMFYDCSSLESLDLSCFDFFFVENLDNLFFGFSSLTSLDTSKMEIVSATNMAFMFYGCNELGSLNFSNWITVYVENINSIFYDCSSLKYLDLSNFDSSSVTDMKNAFFNCIKLDSINFGNFDTSKVTDMRSMFYGCSSLIELNVSSFDTSLVNNMKSMFFGCTKLTSLDLSNFDTRNVINMASMFSECTNLAYINFYNYTEENVENMKDIFFGTSDNLIICINNEENSQNLISQLSSLKCAINDCSIDWKLRKQKIINGKRICTDNCLNNENYQYEFEYFCYDKCPIGTHSSKDNKYICEEDPHKCIENFQFVNIEKNVCIEDCNAENFFLEKCSINLHNNQSQKVLIKNIKEGIKNEQLTILLGEALNAKTEDLIKQDGDTLYQITTSYNQNNKNYENISLIKLGECENIIKENYGLFKEETLIIFKIEKIIKGLKIPLIEYEIFSSKIKKKINLDYCKKAGVNINIYIPININESNLFKYDPNNSFYNDICYTYTTENGTDISLFDRKNEYNNNMLLCTINCQYFGYDLDKRQVICQCQPRNNISLFSIENKDELIEYLKNVKSKTNLKVLKCSKILFSKQGLIKNIGSYFIFLIIIFYIILSIYFFLKGYILLCEQIDGLLTDKILENEIESSSKKDLKYEKDNSTDILSSSKNSNNTNIKNNSNNKFDSETSIKKIILNNKREIKNHKIGYEKKIDYCNYEINTISYEEALENDKRTYFQFYISLLQIKHILIFTFNKNKDFNSFTIKLCLFLFSFPLCLAVNAFFFNDSTLNKIFQYKYKFYDFFPQAIYSSIIIFIFEELLKILALSQQNILQLKHEKNKSNLKARTVTIIKCLKIKFICFFIITYIFLLFFWYYIACFCAVYKNTQIFLILVMLISYLISLIHPFIFCLIPGIFRIPALKGPGKCIYKISQTIQFM